MRIIISISFIFWMTTNLCAQFRIGGNLIDSLGHHISDADIFLQEGGQFIKSSADGSFYFNNLDNGLYSLLISKEGYLSRTVSIQLNAENIRKDIVLSRYEIQAPPVIIIARDNNALLYFRAVDWENMVIGAAKKSEIIELEKIEGNLAANNSRQIYAKIAGLNIWENDNSGIQLNIGGRGLSPNRTSNFNTRQNGYDISADALGYPESYYTPPAQALERIEIIRGAASLQYGTQFGGLLNFRMKKGNKESPFVFLNENTYGSFNFFNTFNSVGGTAAKGKLNYYAYYQFKRGDGWRPYSEFNVHNCYFAITYNFNEKLNISLEQTSMHYLARQPGGLTDLEFNLNPRQSKRPRNWFKVNWNISSLSFDYKISERTKINFRNFALWSDRQSLGNLLPINRVDYGGDRDLIKGFYRNFGNESRMLHRYKISENVNAIALVGIRIYKGFTEQQQGFSNSDSSAQRSDFLFNNHQGILRSDYLFPSFNTAVFAENYFSIGKFAITPGVRYEYINTSSRGYYQNLIVEPAPDGFDTVRNEAVFESRTLPRSILLAGFGASYRPLDAMEIYGNFSQNYRAINFNDMRIINPNQQVDPNLKDEYGFNADLGFRGLIGKYLNFDFSLFYLSYKRRIGNLQVQQPDPENPTIIELVTLRTNIGDARVFGFESLVEWDVINCFTPKNKVLGLSIFSNFALLDGRYIQSENSFASGKKLELLAPLTLKSGLNLSYKNFRFSWQYSFTSTHFSDATNSETTANAVVGRIPSYNIMDASMSYNFRWFRIQAGVNNLMDEFYFTRRATSYPGPGILPADGRNFYVGLRTEIKTKKK